MAKIDFLAFPIGAIRRSIKNIDDSYKNPWDIFAELTQNSVDAIHRMQQEYHEDGIITLEIDAQNRSIFIHDNGCGIAKDDIPVLLRLFSTGKEGDKLAVGEKGVGLKFAYFQSKYFEIISNDGKTGGKAIIRDACLWKKQTSDKMLELDFFEANDVPRGTSITLKEIDVSRDDEQAASIFRLSYEQLLFVLRNKTFLGDTTCLWNSNAPRIELSLKFTDFNGNIKEETIKNEYILPTEFLSSDTIVDIDDFEKWLKQKDRSDTEKRNKLQGKVLLQKGEYLHNGYRSISYWACFMPTRRDWDTVNKNAKLLPEEKDVTDEWLENNAYCMFSPGIYTATKGMPTGISIGTPNTGYAGYWPNFFMLFQDDALSFDIGRKSIHGKIQAIYQAKAKELFAKITKYVTKYTSGTPVDNGSSSTFDRLKIWQEISKMVDINSRNVVFQKSPSDQEASVSAIFFELIGSGKINDINPIYMGYRHKYDLYANFISHNNAPLFRIIEFKSHLKYITKDFSEARKVFDEMDYIVCWEVSDSDIQALSDFGITCEEIEQGSLHPIDCPHAVTHRLTIPNCNPVYVIDLKQMM